MFHIHVAMGIDSLPQLYGGMEILTSPSVIDKRAIGQAPSAAPTILLF